MKIKSAMKTEIKGVAGDRIHIDQQGNIHIYSQGVTKNIGVLFSKNGITSYYKDERERDVMRINDSWSINYEILLLCTGTINYRTERKKYRISAEDAKAKGTFLHFKTSGVERKIYVPRKFWKEEFTSQTTQPQWKKK